MFSLRNQPQQKEKKMLSRAADRLISGQSSFADITKGVDGSRTAFCSAKAGAQQLN